MKSFNFRFVVILAVIAATAYYLYPTVMWARMTPEEVALNPQDAEKYRTKSINLGLDLQGGIHMVLGIQTEKLKQNILLNLNNHVTEVFKEKGLAVIDHRVVGDALEIEVNTSAAAERRADIEESVQRLDFLAAPSFVNDPAKTDRVVVRAAMDRERFEREVREATSRALDIIRNRIDAFGVAEPSIQQVGDRKIVVELPGAADPTRARALIGRTAQLQFHRVKQDAELDAALTAIDQTTGGELAKIYMREDLGEGRFDIYCKPEQRDQVAAIIATPEAEAKFPAGTKVFLGAENNRQGQRIIPIYLLEANNALTGKDLVAARISQDDRGRPAVSFEFGREGAEQFAELTAELMQGQKRLAIVLDQVVQSAPQVNSMIRGSGQITGSFTFDEARDLAVVLRSGALPAPVEVLEQRNIGPSLGRDSIEKGATAALLGFVVVIALMIVWYKGGGMIANFCLILNIFITLACMAAIHGTLTLPGIAGLVLTMGMAVDANILIYERIREEVAAGRGAFSAVNAGYDKAFTTIFDSNLTTLITAAALYQYGTGPIRGFAVTLSIGIIGSMFTAIYVSRFIYDKFVLSARNPRLSI
ncbi:MAG: protein translocase subunit SecD [Candidatus Hydrogenedentota bacterium]